MLTINVPDTELYDESKNLFFTSKGRVLVLEHSLVSVSKWESKWCKAFLTQDGKTVEESRDYIRCMTITKNVPSTVYSCLTQKDLDAVSAYIDAPMTATTFSKQTEQKRLSREVTTSELIYYWMIALTIPMECQKWHLNRLLTLINVCNIKNQPPKKRSKQQILERNKALNAARRKKLNTKG